MSGPNSMRFLNRQAFACLLAVLAATSVPLLVAGAGDSKEAPAPQSVEVRGKVVCLAEEIHKLYQTDLPTNHEHLYGFRTTDGRVYTLLRTKMSEALFVDQQVRDKELIVKGRTFPNTQALEVMSLRSVRNGVVYDLYYYCDVCAIQMVAPEPCVCCQGPVELVEKPLK